MTYRVLPDRFADLIQRLCRLPRESEWVEFKENNPDPEKIGKNVSAIANSAAIAGEARGYVVWGVRDDDHQIVGTTFSPEEGKVGNEELLNWLTRSLHPHLDFSFQTEFVNDKRVVLLIVPAATTQIVRFHSMAYIRIGSYTKPLNDYPEKEKALYDCLSTITFERRIARSGVSDDEVFELLEIGSYYRLAGIQMPTMRRFVLEHLATMAVVKPRDEGGYDITNLGALLFARDLAAFRLDRKAHRTVAYEGTSRVNSRGEFAEPSGYAVAFEKIVDRAMRIVPKRERIRTAIRRSEPVYPLIAVRELVANSLIHQDLSITGAGPMLEIFSGRVEITNPGAPLIPPSRFVDMPPRSRNEMLAKTMRLMGICEERGSGIDRVIELVEREELPPPDFRVTGQNTRAVLFAPIPFDELPREERTRAAYQHACIRWESADYLTNESLRERFALPVAKSSTVSQVIRAAVKEGMKSLHSGSRKAARYVPFYAAGPAAILKGRDDVEDDVS